MDLLLQQKTVDGRPSDAQSQDELSPQPPHYTLVHVRLRILTAALCLAYRCEESLIIRLAN